MFTHQMLDKQKPTNSQEIAQSVFLNMVHSSTVQCAGMIVYRRLEESVEFLLLQRGSVAQCCYPPKGHIEPEESELDAALRETLEETGIQPHLLRLHPHFRHLIHYQHRKGHTKSVVFFLARMEDEKLPTPKMDSRAGWYSADSLLAVLGPGRGYVALFTAALDASQEM